jgi:hypothetical protein
MTYPKLPAVLIPVLVAIGGATVLLADTQPATQPADGEATIRFEQDVYPILLKSCIECHGPDQIDRRGRTRKARAGLRLDSREAILAGGVSETVMIVPGDPEKSDLYRVLVLPIDHEDFMPYNRDPLPADEIETVRRWIAEGADFGEWEKGLGD